MKIAINDVAKKLREPLPVIRLRKRDRIKLAVTIIAKTPRVKNMKLIMSLLIFSLVMLGTKGSRKATVIGQKPAVSPRTTASINIFISIPQIII